MKYTTTLTILDEVNCKFSNLELTDRKTLVNRFKFDVPGARYLPAVRLGRWDGKVSLFQLGGATYINLLPEILEYLDSRGYEIELDDLRDYSRDFEFERFTADTFAQAGKVWPQGHPLEGEPIILRDYQVEAVNRFIENTQCVSELVTGAGKTLITAALSYSVQQYGRSIIIVPNRDLVKQTEADYVNLGLDVGVFFGDRKEYTRQHTICTWQSLHSMQKRSRSGEAEVTLQEFLEGVVCVIVDEVHGAKGSALRDMLTGPMSRIPIRWGLTGTIPKDPLDAITIRFSLGPVMGKLTANELQEQGVLAQCHVNIWQLEDHAEYSNYQAELKYLLENQDRMQYIGSLVEDIRKTGNTLVLVDRISAGQALAETIRDSVFVSGTTKSTDRKEQYDEVLNAEDKVIIATYGVAAVGLNIVRLHNLVLIEPGKSFVRVIQSIGRGLRKGFDKDSVEIYDITSTCKFAKRHLTKRKAYYNEAQYPFNLKRLDWK
jgi:superfamily II DNA or RNA helicase